MTSFTAKATQEDTKVHNDRLILDAIYNQGPVSRADVARATGLTRTTVSATVAELIQDQLVAEVGIGPSLGGRPPILLQLVDDSRYLVGVDLANSEFRGALVDLRGRIRHRLSLPTDDQDGDAALELVQRLIDGLVEIADRPLVGIGIGTPGLMDAHLGIVRHAVNLNWRELPLGDLLEARHHLPVYIANDSQVAAMGELAFGKPKEIKNLIVVKAGRGIGAGLVIDRRLYYGDGFGAGEIGHIVTQPGGRLCRCGNYGCLETMASTRALVQRAQGHFAETKGTPLGRLISSASEINTETLVQALEAGDEMVRGMVEEAGLHLGRALAYVVGTIDINCVVISGRMAAFGETLIDPIRREVTSGFLPILSAKTQIEASLLGEDIVILGAAALLLSEELGLS